jgi:hypothetical protein
VTAATSVRTKAKAVRQIARKLLLARVRLMKARVAARSGGAHTSKTQLALQKRLASTQARGVAGILEEFKAADVLNL